MAYSALIGARVKRKEDPRLITGTGNYVGDIKLPPFSLISLALLCVGLIGRPLETLMRPRAADAQEATDAMEGKT